MNEISYEESFAYHIEIELGLNLDDIWSWGKNNELGINPYKIKKQSNKKVWLYCQKHDYHNYDREGNKIGYRIMCGHFYNGNRCSYCCGRHNIHWRDSLAYKYPKIAEMIAIPENKINFEDCFNIGFSSGKRFYFKCLNCKTVSNSKLTLNQVTRTGFSCKYCSDGISIPNKFMSNLLKQLRVNFQSEYNPYYFRITQRIDFLLIDYNIIIEMDGNYGNHTREYDYWRDFLNMKYGGYKTIRIDLTNSEKYYKDTLNYIKEQIINSELSNLFDLYKINWLLIWEQCQKSKCIEVWDLWNSGNNVTEIATILDTDRHTITRYLKQGKKYNKCNYSVEESRKRKGKKYGGKNNYNVRKVICITTYRVFSTIKDGSEYYNVVQSSIINCCKGKCKSAGKLKDGTKLIWKYININHNKRYYITKEQHDIINKHKN